MSEDTTKSFHNMTMLGNKKNIKQTANSLIQKLAIGTGKSSRFSGEHLISKEMSNSTFLNQVQWRIVRCVYFNCQSKVITFMSIKFFV